ncbi:hypothetical protein LOZ12_000048 [Ophidiomyces ophidiicola]|uniref:Uncharacterized protein n=1 Tax=Ophidiomyces ophidiicola TaxID=1387563 RepID=A0ACB8V5M6_9EURO|nr:uncharacterized protein LOZ57_006059 [Ophidiomyces ophidiicola]KAI1911594.1 hypothetical protein LOZ64_004644 [Ophidiomyces ophidiicola]KAI1939775.1 hypothetical protein LOZ57_006059 [Ophidiomyces ophidiicola]KAI1956159.1 hypothetical protein LOZ62_000153 [Ophidiomyces ophidiicola]KAI1967842.1 hypothetical protein LOZ59_000659 [Ophidiomyces ophidiicola]KAI1970323.1 hypothetical protein LOZ56_003798 [Ophidiomyces ophidiicola]
MPFIAQSPAAEIWGDLNYDGKVDITGDADVSKNGREAIFLANIGDTGQRCSQMPQFQGSLSSENVLDTCNDASEELQRSPQYMAPLRTVPMPGLSADASGRLSLSGSRDINTIIRLFLKKVQQISPRQSSSRAWSLGLILRQTRNPGWNGRVTVTFSVEDKGVQQESKVNLRVAPVLTHHHLQKAEHILISDPNQALSERPWFSAFFDRLTAALAEAGLAGKLTKLNTDDRWAQDFLETGFTSMPVPNGPITLRIMIRSSQSFRSVGRLAYLQLRNNGTGAVQYIGGSTGRYTTESLGNLETIPPYEHNNVKYPGGRTIMGLGNDPMPHILAFLDAQEVQKPLTLDTSWLAAAHVEEFLTFIPANTPRGWRLMYGGVQKGLDFLKQVEKDGHGRTPFFSRPAEDTEFKNFAISDLLADEEFLDLNAECSKRTLANINILKNETGLTDSEIIGVHALYHDLEKTSSSRVRAKKSNSDLCPKVAHNIMSMTPNDAAMLARKRPSLSERRTGAAQIQARQVKEVQAVSFFPSFMNGLLVSSSQYLAPQPFGPSINGTDVLQEVLLQSMKESGYNVQFIDDRNFFLDFGDVHCGTNALRESRVEWWK